MESRPLIVKSALSTQTGGFLADGQVGGRGITHSLNPYVGCTFGRGGACPFCYVRELGFVQMRAPKGEDGRRVPWGEWVNHKANLSLQLEKELKRAHLRGTASSIGVFMSSVTDPYQGIEAELNLTRSCLEVFRRYPVGALVVQTRSVLVARDLDLLAQMPFAQLNLTVETNREDIRRSLTPTSPTFQRRLGVLQLATSLGIATQAVVAPLLPYSPDFAHQLASSARRILIDTLLDGDGAGGRRSRKLGMGEKLATLGHPDWLGEEGKHAAHLLRQELTRLDVPWVWSCAGFGDLGLVGCG